MNNEDNDKKKFPWPSLNEVQLHCVFFNKNLKIRSNTMHSGATRKTKTATFIQMYLKTL